MKYWKLEQVHEWLKSKAKYCYEGLEVQIMYVEKQEMNKGPQNCI